MQLNDWGSAVRQFLDFDIGFNYNQQSDQCKLECYICQKKSILFFNIPVYNTIAFTKIKTNILSENT